MLYIHLMFFGCIEVLPVQIPNTIKKNDRIKIMVIYTVIKFPHTSYMRYCFV